ncbi:unnamed protein product [Symbiodinium sp. KB8]|nr:unnamed protein product [Symbiodinium sp. KB8]
MSGEKEQHHVPSWDGSARTWRRYTKEVSWFVQSTPVNKRRYCASRLLSRLTGPARLLAMSWSWTKMHFDTPEGTKLFLQRLAASPLVRKNLPNAAAICNQYFAFQRRQGENISSFLVRESLVHEEFCEAIIRLHEDRLGISQESRDFGLPPEEPYSWDSDSWAGTSWWRDDWGDEDLNETEGQEGEPAGDPPEARAGDPEGPREATTTSAAPGSSPSHAGDRTPARTSPPADPRPSEEATKAVDELALADSFIMQVLRGWRLLQAAGLNAEEKRDILSTTKNSLDYEVIAAALQNLWDEQLLGQRHGPASYQAHYSEAVDAETAYYQDDWWFDDGSWWYDSFYSDGGHGETWWDDYGYEGHDQMVATEPEDPENLEKIKEAQQAEKIAEGLAAEAQRTWAEAQRATQALRKDRGFGAMAAQGPGGGCFLCGGSHFARDCPRRQQMSFGKGPKGSNRFSKGKAKGYMNEMDEDYYANVFKGKSKGKGKKGFLVDPAYAMWSSKGKGKTKNKDSYRPVNAYQSELFVGGLDMVLEAASASSEPVDPNVGMIDCGATASAAPEAVVKGLINAVLAQDRSAQIEMDQALRPYFRFGNGRWGRALCKMSASTQRHLDPEVNAILQQAAKARPKAKAKPLDMSRAQKIDLRDPRASKTQWPCLGQHSPGPAKGNGHGQWLHCQVCDVRLLYVPRHGSTGQCTQCKNPEMVARCLRELRKLLGDRIPTATLVHAMQAKIDAEETLNVMINDHLSKTGVPSSSPTISNPTSATTATGYATGTPESPESLGSWSMANAEGREVTLEEAYAALDHQQ